MALTALYPRGLGAKPAIDPELLTLCDVATENQKLNAEPGAHSECVSLFAQGSISPEAMSALNVQVGTDAGGVMTLQVPRAALRAFLDLPGLQRAQLGTALEPLLDESVPATGTPDMWQGTPPSYSGYSGAGVILGIVDTGIDVNHQDFKKSTGATRILSLWDQSAPTLNPPSGFTYGRLWTAAQIDAGQCTEMDGDGHGTHLAGIAAGNGRGTGNGRPAYRYVGVAPEADLVVVKTKGLSTDVVDGVNFIFQLATAQGKNAVVCIAFGTQKGSHDGTDPMEQALNSLSGRGKIVCAAVGNAGALAIHGEATVSPSTPRSITVRIPTYTPPQVAEVKIVMEGWYNSNHTVSLRLRSPAGTTFGPIARGGSVNVETGQGYLQMYNGFSSNSRGDQQLYVTVFKSQVDVASGVWELMLTSQTAGAGVDFWITEWSFNSQSPAVEVGLSFNKTAVVPATADSVLTAGAYCTKPNWVALNGSTYGFSNAVENAIASWSGKGPTRLGRQVPDVCAPGQGVGSAKSAPSSVSQVYMLQDGVHSMRQGTSAAAAHLAGVVALFLERQPGMLPSEVRSAIRHGAHQDSYTGAIPNPTWGYGKLFVGSDTVGVGDGVSRSLVFDPPFPNPSTRETQFAVALSSQDLQREQGPLKILILDVRGRVVARIPGARTAGTQRLTWNGFTPDGRKAPAGLYFARLEFGSAQAVRRFLRMQ